MAQENPSDSALKEKEEAEVQRGHNLGSSSIILVNFHILGELVNTSEVIGTQTDFIKALCARWSSIIPPKKRRAPRLITEAPSQNQPGICFGRISEDLPNGSLVDIEGHLRLGPPMSEVR